MLRICTIELKVSSFFLNDSNTKRLHCHLGQVDDEPEEALTAFREIVEQETEKGDWFVLPPI